MRLAVANRKNSRWCSLASCPSSTSRTPGTHPLHRRKSRLAAEASERPPRMSGLPAGTQGKFSENGCPHHSQWSSGTPGSSTSGLEGVKSPSAASSSEETLATGEQGGAPITGLLAAPLGLALGAAASLAETLPEEEPGAAPITGLLAALLGSGALDGAAGLPFGRGRR